MPVQTRSQTNQTNAKKQIDQIDVLDNVPVFLRKIHKYLQHINSTPDANDRLLYYCAMMVYETKHIPHFCNTDLAQRAKWINYSHCVHEKNNEYRKILLQNNVHYDESNPNYCSDDLIEYFLELCDKYDYTNLLFIHL